MSKSVCLLLIKLMLFVCWGSHAQSPELSHTHGWEVQSLGIRASGNRTKATLPVAIYKSGVVHPKHVLLYLSSFTDSLIPASQVDVALNPGFLWIRMAPFFAAQGISVAVVDIPSDASHRSLPERPLPEITGDIKTAVEYLSQRFPGAQIHLTGFGPDVGELILAVSKDSTINRIIIASGDFRNYRTEDWSSLKQSVLVFHAPGTQCDLAPFHEAEYVARKNNFFLVKVGYSQQEREIACGARSQVGFPGLESEFVTMVSRWLDGDALPTTIGYSDPPRAWREQVVRYDVTGSLTTEGQREMTLLFPQGRGPFPVVIFYHGDIPVKYPWIRFKRRFVDMVIAREFLNLGWAVAFPARGGVGLSDGVYSTKLVDSEFNPTNKGRYHASDTTFTINYLRTLQDVDTKRILISGQSAGGLSAMQIGSMNLPGVVGIVNFSGAPSDVMTTTRYSHGRLVITENHPAFINNVMINAFTEFGKTTTVPTLWIFAENDSRYSANSIKESYAAFLKAGGKATLLLAPPMQEDGHMIYQSPELWRQTLSNYIQRFKL